MSISIKGGHSTSEVDATNLSGLTVNLNTGITSNISYASVVIEADDGSVYGTKTIRPLYVTQDYRTNRNLEKPIWDDVFCHSVINNTKYKVSATTQTITVANGFLNLNAGDDVSAGTSSAIQTFKYFPIYMVAPMYVNIKAKFSETLQTNSVTEFGLGLFDGTERPYDGCFFRASAGTLNAVVIKRTYEVTNVDVFTPLSGVLYDYLLAINDNDVEFWIDDVIVSKIVLPSFTGGTSLPNSLPLFARNYNSGGTVPSAIQFNIARWNVLFGDLKLNRDWRTTMSLNGQSSIASPDGQAAKVTGTTTANLVNNTAPIVATATNTTAAYSTLGGEFNIVASGGSETDYALFAYLNPAGTSSIPGKTLVIQNVYIDLYTTGAAMGASPTLFQWSLGVGGTNVSLLEQDSVDLGTKATRRIALGQQSISASTAIGTVAMPRIEFEPGRVPLIVEAGTYCHVILRIPTGLQTASLFYRGFVTINGYFE